MDIPFLNGLVGNIIETLGAALIAGLLYRWFRHHHHHDCDDKED